MITFKCKMCGGDLKPIENATTCQCDYCGSLQTIPTADNEKKMNLFGRAQRLLRSCDFDKAAGVFESIVAEFPTEAEAYWGLVLCKYGIEYIDDPKTGRKIPTCHRSSFDSIMDDTNFDQATENADSVARKLYREEAKQIEELRKRVIEVSNKEEPYDIFICFKETDDKGNRTLDSVLAQDIYQALVEKQYKVFFSRITLEDKLGQEYEPYIFAALNSSKIMLVVGTDYEYFNSVWVKNEWSRYIHLIASGAKKTLIPCYKNIDAYDMPKEFAKLQSLDLGKIGAIQDLIRGIEKLLLSDKDTNSSTKSDALSKSNESLLQNYLSMANNALSSGNYNEAETYCNKVLELDFNSAAVWEVKGLVALHYSDRILEAANHFNNALKNSTNQEDCGKRILDECMTIIDHEIDRLIQSWKIDLNNSQVIINYTQNVFSMLRSIHIENLAIDEHNENLAKKIESASTYIWDNKMTSILREDGGHPGKGSFDTFLQSFTHPIDLLEAVCVDGTNRINRIQRLRKLISWTNSASGIRAWHFQTEDEAMIQHGLDYAARTGINGAINRRLYPPVWVEDYRMSDEYIMKLKRKSENWQSQIKQVESEINKIRIAEEKKRQEELRLKEQRIAEYWNAHADERHTLEGRIEQIKQSLIPHQEAISAKTQEIRKLHDMANDAVKPLEELDKKLLDQIRTLESQRASLGIFKGKEKKRITDQIDQLSQKRPSWDEIQSRKKEELQKLQPQIDHLQNEISELQKIISELNGQIAEINEEFQKDR